MPALNKQDLGEINDLLLSSLDKSEDQVNTDFFTWSDRKRPLVQFSHHDGRISNKSVIWDDELTKK